MPHIRVQAAGSIKGKLSFIFALTANAHLKLGGCEGWLSKN